VLCGMHGVAWPCVVCIMLCAWCVHVHSTPVGGNFRPVVAAPASGRLLLRVHEAQFKGKVTSARLVASVTRLGHLCSVGGGAPTPIMDCEAAPVAPAVSKAGYATKCVYVDAPAPPLS
jgi:hypothetical protein